jgi:hypothetical protein
MGWRYAGFCGLEIDRLAGSACGSLGGNLGLDVSRLLWAWQLIHSSISLSTQPTT